MCDYSLAGIPNRLAVEGEQLVVYQFPTGARGLTCAASRPSRSWPVTLWSAKETPAVCVPPGGRLLLRDIPEHLQRLLNVGPIEEVTFVQQSAMAYQYRDAVHFENGREVLLQRLQCGQSVEVLSLESPDPEADDLVHQFVAEEYRRVFAG